MFSANLQNEALSMLPVAGRLVGMLLIAPAFGHIAVPVKVRVLLGLVMSLAVVGRLGESVAPPSGLGELLLATAAEFVTGAVIGYAAGLLLVGIEMAAFHVSQQLGLALGDVFDPMSGEAGGVVRPLFDILAVVIFLLVGGHRALIAAAIDTFRMARPLSGLGVGGLLNMTVSLLAASFVLALKAAGPVLITMLLVTAALGILQKSMPECHILSTHLPVRVMAGMLALAASVGVLLPLINASVEALVKSVSALAAGGT